jgi:hypothetical protein
MLVIGVALVLLLGGLASSSMFESLVYICSSHSSPGVFSSTIVKGRLVLADWCFEFKVNGS